MALNKYKDGHGIEWTKIPDVDNPGEFLPGASWNPTNGCLHCCVFNMPDGAMIGCYAGALANRFNGQYPHGFAHHYWHPARLDDPVKEKKPHGIFLGSMADVWGRWVTIDQIDQILKVCRDTQQHTYFTLTKNPRRMLTFNLPENVWAGCSLPGGPLLPRANAYHAMRTYLRYMLDVKATVRWLSLEPLWFDVAEVLRDWVECGFPLPIDWMVIGAGSDGNRLHQPEPEWVQGLIDFCDANDVPVFMKNNLAWTARMMQFPNG